MTPEEQQEQIKQEREHYRSVYWAAYAKYRDMGYIPAHSCLMEGAHVEGRQVDNKKWSDWRADFVNAGRRILHGGEEGADQTEWIVFSRHMIFLEESTYEENGKVRCEWFVMPPGRSIRKTVALIHRIYGQDKAIGMNLFGSVKRIVSEKVGGELERRGLWPLDEYFRGRVA